MKKYFLVVTLVALASQAAAHGDSPVPAAAKFSSTLRGKSDTLPRLTTETTFAPTQLPSGVPSPLPSAAPSMLPVPAPSKVPVPAPSEVPVPAPTPAPTMPPTASDTVTVEVSMEMAASAPPTTSDEDTLKTIIAESVGVNEDTIKKFTVTSTANSRRRRLFASTYIWAVAFEVSSSLEELDLSSPDEFLTRVTSALTSDSFVASVTSSVGATVDTSSISIVLATRNPSMSPTTLAPKSDDAKRLPVFLGVAGGCLAVVAVITAAFFIWRKNKQNSKETEMTLATARTSLARQDIPLKESTIHPGSSI